MDNCHQQLTTFMNYLPLTTASTGNHAVTTNRQIGGRHEQQPRFSNLQAEVEYNGTQPACQGSTSYRNNNTTTSMMADSRSLDHHADDDEGDTSDKNKNNLNNNTAMDDSGYNSSASSVTPPARSSSSRSRGGGGGGGDCSSSVVDLEEMDDLEERIEFLHAKQSILEKAAHMLFPENEEDLLLAEKATRRSLRSAATRQQQKQQRPHPPQPRQLAVSHSTCSSLTDQQDSNNSSSGNDSASYDSEEEAGPAANSIWAEALQVLETLNATNESNNNNNNNTNTKNKKTINKNNEAQPEETFSSNVPRWKQQPHDDASHHPKNPKHPHILMSGVKRVGSLAFDGGGSGSLHCDQTSTTSSLSTCSSGQSQSPPPSPSPESFKSSCLLGVVPRDHAHWMAQALIQTSQQQQQQQKKEGKEEEALQDANAGKDWKVVSCPLYTDPSYPMPLLVAPPNCFRPKPTRSIDINEATSPQTTLPRLVTQATPPFLVVYANRAFLQFLEQGQTNNRNHAQDESAAHDPFPEVLHHHHHHHHPQEAQHKLPVILGRPVESLIHVIHGLARPGDEESPVLDQKQHAWQTEHYVDSAQEGFQNCSIGTTSSSSQGRRNQFEGIVVATGQLCQIKVVPVIDRSSSPACKKSRLMPGLTAKPSSWSMSHVMVQVEPTAQVTDLVRTAATTVTTSTVASRSFGQSSSSSTTTLLRPQAFRVVRQRHQQQQEYPIRHSSSSTEEDDGGSSSSDDGGNSNGSPPNVLLGMVG
ncbi:hypothetical protein ACA910_008751 [Epithemia clementina (nom. ined.)]